MSKPLAILIIGSTSTEPSLIKQQLCKRWPALVLERVESVDELQTALNQKSWDCVLLDLCFYNVWLDNSIISRIHIHLYFD